ncbi:MAG: hypothetical protein ACYC1C_20375 [Chloroflexota bacterium]
MANRFEAELETYLARIFSEKLSDVLESAGFHETVRIHEPHVTEYQRNRDVLSLQTERVGPDKIAVSVESESIDVDPLIGLAARDVIVDVCDRMLSSLPWVDRQGARQHVEAYISTLLANHK